jgi:hypothetical protein
LVIVGGGMLAQALEAHVGAGRYSRVFILSRVERKIRTKVGENTLVCGLDDSRRLFCPGVTDWLIATTNLTNDYAAGIQDAMRHCQAQNIVDLSSGGDESCFRLSGVRAITTKSQQFKEAIRTSNSLLLPVLEHVHQELESIVQMTADDLQTSAANHVATNNCERIFLKRY